MVVHQKGNMGLRVYVASATPNTEIKKQIQRVVFVLDSMHIEYQPIDITEPGHVDDREFMKMNGKPKDGKPTPLPPQIFNEEEYCGDYDGFEEAIEEDQLYPFLKLGPNPAKKDKHVTPQVNESLSNGHAADEANTEEVLEKTTLSNEEAVASKDEGDEGESETKDEEDKGDENDEKGEEKEETKDEKEEVKNKEEEGAENKEEGEGLDDEEEGVEAEDVEKEEDDAEQSTKQEEDEEKEDEKEEEEEEKENKEEDEDTGEGLDDEEEGVEAEDMDEEEEEEGKGDSVVSAIANREF